MKVSNIIIGVILLALCVAGWVGMTTEKVSEGNEYTEHLELAEDCMARGLYQRAAENYLLAMGDSADEELYVKAVDAYSLRYAQAPEETREAYLELLSDAIAAFPMNTGLLNRIIPLYLAEENDRLLYSCLKTVVDGGCEDPGILEAYRDVRYIFTLRGNGFKELRDYGTGIYCVTHNEGWNLYSSTDGFVLTEDVKYTGPCSEEGIAVVVDDSAMLYDTGKKEVLGFFKGEVTAAGLFSEGLVPVKVDGSYGYYNDFGDFQFGKYEYAGTFQDGFAAVCENGHWKLVDSDGADASENFDEIVLDESGRAVFNGGVLAKKDGTYTFYNEKWEKQWELQCDEMGLRAEDGITAYRTGEKWGFVAQDGTVLIEPQFAYAKSFSNGLTAIQNSEGQWGFINVDGQVVIDFQFDGAGYLNGEGMCPVLTSESDGPSEVIQEWRLLRLTFGVTG